MMQDVVKAVMEKLKQDKNRAEESVVYYKGAIDGIQYFIQALEEKDKGNEGQREDGNSDSLPK